MLNSTDKIIKHKTGLLNLAEELGMCNQKASSDRVGNDCNADQAVIAFGPIE